jgi:hypothetical protein
MRVLQYPYEENVGKMLIGIMLFGAGTAGFIYMFQSSGRGLILNHLIELSSSQAAIFYLLMAAIFGVFVLINLFAIIANIRSSKQLVLTESLLSVPNTTLSGKQQVLQVSDIQRLALFSVRGRYLYVYHPGGKVIIAEERFPSGAAFDELCQALAYLTQHSAA